MTFNKGEKDRKYQDSIDKLYDLREGQYAMRCSKYLEQWPMEDSQSYANRVRHTILTNYTEKTVYAAKGMVFRKPLAYGELKLDDENVDSEGQSLNKFAQDVCESGLWFGHSCIVVDAPSRDGIRTLADERAAGVKPYFILVERQSILDYKIEYINGKAKIMRIEIEEQPADDARRQVRVMFPGGGEIWRQYGDGDFVLVNEWSNALGYVPLSVFYTRRAGVMESRPMFSGVADHNIDHFQDTSQVWVTKRHMRPILKQWGMTIDQEQSGSHSIIMSVNTAMQWADKDSGDAEWLEYNGQAIDRMMSIMDSTEQRMAQIGLSMLSNKTETKEITATEKAIDAAQETADLSTIAANLEDALNKAYVMWCDMAGVDAGEERISVNTEFVSELLTVEEMRELREQYASGLLDKETFWFMMESGGRFRGVDVELLKARVEAEEPGFAAG